MDVRDSPADGTEVVDVRPVPERTRYEILVDGEVAGSTHYRTHRGRLVFDHTVIDERFSGRGLGSRLAQGALDHVRSQGLRIVPLCEFLAGWVDKHPDYADLVDRELLAEILASR